MSPRTCKLISSDEISFKFHLIDSCRNFIWYTHVFQTKYMSLRIGKCVCKFVDSCISFENHESVKWNTWVTNESRFSKVLANAFAIRIDKHRPATAVDLEVCSALIRDSNATHVWCIHISALIRDSNATHSALIRDSALIRGSALIRDSNATRVWCIHMWDVAQSYLRHDWFINETWFVAMFRITRLSWCTCDHCNTLQHTATHCNTLQHTAAQSMFRVTWLIRCTSNHCNTLQHTATHCNTLQHSATQSMFRVTRLSWCTSNHCNLL